MENIGVIKEAIWKILRIADGYDGSDDDALITLEEIFAVSNEALENE